MNHFSVDGVELSVPVNPDTSFHDLIQYIREGLASERSLISCVKVDGLEITGAYERQIAATPISELKSVEITTSHPRELADDTLQHLLEYSHVLESLSFDAGQLAGEASFHEKFNKLIDGITTFTEAITGVKNIMKVGYLQPVNLLEADLLSILKDLLTSRESGQIEYTAGLLKEYLPKNLEQWRETAIPALIRSRDN
jgi:hypothetical protein